jgi:hypothetical protein
MATTQPRITSIVQRILLLITLAIAHNLDYEGDFASPLLNAALNGTDLSINSIPYSTRVHWMREANAALLALSGPCPFAAFGSVIVNHSDATSLGELVCIGANANRETGNPVMHGQ